MDLKREWRLGMKARFGRSGFARTMTLAAICAGGLVFGASGEAAARSLEGAYLKARYASLQNDLTSAAIYFREAASYDPAEPKLTLPAFYFSLLVGEADAAARLSEGALTLSSGDRLARLTTVAKALRDKDGAKAKKLLEAREARGSVLPMTRRLLQGWAAYASGDLKAAEKILIAPPPAGLVPPKSRKSRSSGAEAGKAPKAEDRARRQKDLAAAYTIFGRLHLGLMAAADGEDAKALESFTIAKDAAGGWSPQLGREAAVALRRLGRKEEAAAIYDELLASDPGRPAILAAKASMERGEKPVPMVRSAAEGAAAALYGVGVRLRGDRNDPSVAIYFLQLARWLKPDFYEARFAAATELGEIRQHALAAELFAGVPPSSPLGELARIGRAEAMARGDDLEGARSVLNRLAAAKSERPSVYLTLGAVESAGRNFEACATAYEKALMHMKKPSSNVLFRLGVCREQGGDWSAAEAAFVEALELEPRQPDVLNHFGYGLVEQGRRLAEARRMLEVAVEERPDSGYIVDSLGWALYRLGDYKGAVKHLEQAVSLEPSESVINDHFGDALWRVGRHMEARFQWRRALSFEPTDEERPRIERKLEIGLDKVLAEEEGAAKAGPKKVEDAGHEQRAKANDG